MHRTAPRTRSSDDTLFSRRVRPQDWRNPQPKDLYDLVIIGAGPAGIAAAEYAARRGFSVALVERTALGGDTLHTGSVPSKALIRTAHVYDAMRDADEFGAPLPEQPALDFAAALARMRRIRTRISVYHSADELAALGIDIFFGTARFAGSNRLCIDKTLLPFRKALIATGARPKIPDIPGLEQAGYQTSSTIFDVKELPKRLVVIGGGPLGCELAQAFCRLGSHVTIVQNNPKFLPREERDAAEILNWSMARDGMEIRLNTIITAARRDGDTKILETLNNEMRGEIAADEILVCTGRLPNIETLDLAAASIASNPRRGITVDEFLCSSNPDVYAAGDACLPLKFTNAAQSSARIAAANALTQGGRKHDNSVIPWCTYCSPEIAHIGLQVWDARRQSIPIKSYTVMLNDIDRAITDGEETGFVKIHIAEGTDRILGATIVASHASELINEIAVIMSTGIGMTALAEVIHTYPAQSGAILQAAQAYRRDVDTAVRQCTPGGLYV